MSKLLAVGVTGRARHGKDTVSDMFVADGATKFSFAAALKDLALRIDPVIAARTVFDINDQQVPELIRLSEFIDTLGAEKAKTIEEVRRFYQYLGTEARHVLGPDVWVNAVKKDAQRLVAQGHPVVFSDVRFPNEAEMVRDLGGIVIRVVRMVNGPFAGLQMFDNGVDPTHPSESQVDDLGHAFTLYNDAEGISWQTSLRAQLERKLHEYLMGANFYG